jgi:hypothetical protein
LRSSLKTSSRDETKAFVSRLNRKFVMIRKSVNKLTAARCKRSLKMKEITKKNEIFTILLINLHVYEELNCLMNDWTSHSMNNSIIYEESFNSTKKRAYRVRANNTRIEKSTFLLTEFMKNRISCWSQTIINRKNDWEQSITSKNNIKTSKKSALNERIACEQTI